MICVFRVNKIETGCKECVNWIGKNVSTACWHIWHNPIDTFSTIHNFFRIDSNLLTQNVMLDVMPLNVVDLPFLGVFQWLLTKNILWTTKVHFRAQKWKIQEVSSFNPKFHILIKKCIQQICTNLNWTPVIYYVANDPHTKLLTKAQRAV